MAPKSKHKNSVLKNSFPLLLALLLIIISIETGRAADVLSQGFAKIVVAGVRGTKASMYTGNPPSPLLAFVANLTGICDEPGVLCPAGSDLFETGWIKGSQTGGALKHYISYRGGSIADKDYGYTLANENWYLLQTLYSNSAGRWEGWLNGVPRLVLNFSLGWTSGEDVTCGLESKHILGTSPPTATGWCKNTQYKVGTGSWTYYNHTHEIENEYCVISGGNYYTIAYGPVTGSCP